MSERDTSIDQVPLTRPQPGAWPTIQTCALTGTRTCHLSVCRMTPNPLSHTHQGSFSFITGGMCGVKVLRGKRSNVLGSVSAGMGRAAGGLSRERPPRSSAWSQCPQVSKGFRSTSARTSSRRLPGSAARALETIYTASFAVFFTAGSFPQEIAGITSPSASSQVLIMCH